MSEGWARVRNVYQCCDFTVIFWGGTLRGGGGGTPDLIHAYVKWGGGSKPGIAPRARHISKFSWGRTPKPPAGRGCYP